MNMKKIILWTVLIFSNYHAVSQCWSSISAGSSHTSAIKSDGTLWTWGRGNFNQLGQGTQTNSLVPGNYR